MKMNIEKMLEYQASDQIIYKAEQAFSSSPENRRYSQIVAKINELRATVIKLDKEAADIRKDIEKKEKQLEELGIQAERSVAQMSDEKSLNEINRNEEIIKSFEDGIDAADKEFFKAVKRLEDIEREAKQALVEVKRCNTDLEKSKLVLQKKRAEMQAELQDEGAAGPRRSRDIQKGQKGKHTSADNGGVRRRDLPRVRHARRERFTR